MGSRFTSPGFADVFNAGGPRKGSMMTTTRMDLPVASGVSYRSAAVSRAPAPNITITIHITHLPGEDGEALAERAATITIKKLIQGGSYAEGGTY